MELVPLPLSTLLSGPSFIVVALYALCHVALPAIFTYSIFQLQNYSFSFFVFPTAIYKRKD
jgi:hypothetical protein